MASDVFTLRVLGYRDLMRALRVADRDDRLAVRRTFREVGEVVRLDAMRRFFPVDSRSAAGYKVGVRQTGAVVYQSIRKTTGKHPEYGSLQMRKALIPALRANEQKTAEALEHALDLVADQFNRQGGVHVGD